MEGDVARSTSEFTAAPIASTISALGSVVRLSYSLEVINKFVWIFGSVVIALSVGRIFRTISNVVTRLRASIADVVRVQGSRTRLRVVAALVLPLLVGIIFVFSFIRSEATSEVPSCASWTPRTSCQMASKVISLCAAVFRLGIRLYLTWLVWSLFELLGILTLGLLIRNTSYCFNLLLLHWLFLQQNRLLLLLFFNHNGSSTSGRYSCRLG